MGKTSRNETRHRRRKRVRKKIKGTPERPRLNVFRSSKHIYAQIIDDINARTLADASSLAKDVKENIQGQGGNRKGAAIIGESIAKHAIEKGIKQVVFDRNGFLYHGRIKAFADGAREGGLKF